MRKIVKLSFLAAIFALLNACESESKFNDLAEAIERNKLNISSIVVEPTKGKTIEIAGVPCDPCAATYLATGQVETFNAYGLTPDNQRLDISESVEWSTSNTAIAQITQNGAVTAQANPGNVDIIASLASIDGRTPVVVSSATLVGPESIIFRDSQGVEVVPNTRVTICDTYELQMVGDFIDTTFGNSKRIITHEVGLTALAGGSDTTNAKVVLNDANLAVFSSHEPGTEYTVKAAYSKNTTTPVEDTLEMDAVTDGFGTVISISPPSQTIAPNATFQFTASATINGVPNKDITGTANWVSNFTTIAVVTGGLVTAKGSPGEVADITASCSSTLKGTAKVTIEEEVTVARIEIRNATNNSTIGSLQLNLRDPAENDKELKLIAVYVDGEEENISETATVRVTDYDDSPLDLVTTSITGTESNRKLLVTANRIGYGLLKVSYSGRELELGINVINQ